MAMETVTNYRCDRCGRSELTDKATILTLTVRARAGDHVPGQGKSEYTRHICQDNCLKMIKNVMAPVNKPGHYDRSAAALRRKSATASTPATKNSTKKPQTAVSRTKTASESPSIPETRADVVRAVRAITRRKGKYAPGYGPAQERRMIAERESNQLVLPTE